MSHDGGHEQNHNQGGQQPGRPDDKGTRQRQINATNSEKRQHRLPARLRFVEVMRSVLHKFAIARNERGTE